MLSDPYLLVTVAAEFILMLLGAAISLQDDWAKRHRRQILAAFCVVGVAGMFATIRTAEQSAIASSQLSNSVSQLAVSSKETVRLEGLNTQLQQQLLAQSSTCSC
jgi:hypothetical protein